MIIETVVTTRHADGRAHIAPLGVRQVTDSNLNLDLIVLAPFRPSTTLDNLQRERCAVINLTDDVRVFAGCLTGRRDWPVRPSEMINGWVLEQALAHRELEVERIEDDPLRPQFFCRQVHAANHGVFAGFNRAQAAVVEAAILASRLHLLPAEKINREMAYLSIAVEKTAGERERQAWCWLQTHIAEFRAAAAQH